MGQRESGVKESVGERVGEREGEEREAEFGEGV